MIKVLIGILYAALALHSGYMGEVELSIAWLSCVFWMFMFAISEENNTLRREKRKRKNEF